MLTDRYGLELSTGSREAHTAYLRGVDLLLSANVGATEAFEQSIAAIPGSLLAMPDLRAPTK
jgi:hypothetical protein